MAVNKHIYEDRKKYISFLLYTYIVLKDLNLNFKKRKNFIEILFNRESLRKIILYFFCRDFKDRPLKSRLEKISK